MAKKNRGPVRDRSEQVVKNDKKMVQEMLKALERKVTQYQAIFGILILDDGWRN